MTRLFALSSREYSSFFRTPLGWVVIALFLCLSGAFFVARSLVPGDPASMSNFFGMWWALLLFVAPAISMRLFAEEFRTGTIETIMTAPVREGVLVGGKFLAAVLLLISMLLPTVVYVIILDQLSRPDFGPILSGYLGLLLLGMLYLAIGTLASVLTSSQTLSFLATLFALLLLDFVPGQLASHLSAPFDAAVLAVSPARRMADFTSGLIDTRHIAFFLAATLWFLALSTVVLQSRRWR